MFLQPLSANAAVDAKIETATSVAVAPVKFQPMNPPLTDSVKVSTGDYCQEIPDFQSVPAAFESSFKGRGLDTALSILDRLPGVL